MWKFIIRTLLFFRTSFKAGREISITQYYLQHLLRYGNSDKDVFSPNLKLVKSQKFQNKRKELKKLRYKLELHQNMNRIFQESK